MDRYASRLAYALLVAAIACGALAFGAVYPWGYLPLAACGPIVFALTFVGLRSHTPVARALTLSLVAVGAAIACQLVPIDLERLGRWTPETIRALSELDPAVAAHVIGRHASSIAPNRTMLSLALFAANTALLFGCARLFSARGARRFAESVAVIGIVLALIGIVQHSLWNGKLYGFWTPIEAGQSYGPFVNKNHFAGWMLMALPLTLGLVCGRALRALEGVKPTWRARLTWLSSPEANRLILLAAGAAVMALALVLTMSRSGISAFALALAVTGTVVARQQRGVRRVALIGYFVLLVVLACGWAGMDAIAARFSGGGWNEIDGRRGAWSDAIDIAARFPIGGTGLDTYGVATLLYQRHDLARHYREAHNDYLQLAAEGGMLVVVPALIALVCLVVVMRRRFEAETSLTTYWLRVGAATGLLAVAFQEMVDFSLQMPANAALFVALCGIAIHRTPQRGNANRV